MIEDIQDYNRLGGLKEQQSDMQIQALNFRRIGRRLPSDK
jgi:hypothetical protein